MLKKIEYFASKIIKKLHLRAVSNSDIHKTSKICSGSQIINTKIGKHSDVGYDCTIINAEIGAFCSFGANIVIGGASHTIDWVSTSPVFNENKDHLPQKFSYHKFDLESKTIVGADVWIGNYVLIKPNVTIGHGAVIGMGSVVTKDIPPYEIWGGNPARLIRKRFDDATIKELLEMQWWNWDDNEIKKRAGNFNDVQEFIKK